MVSHTFPGIAPLVTRSGTFDARLQRYIDGEGYQAAIGPQSPAAGGQFVRTRLRNPASSGKTIYVVLAVASSNVINFLRTGSITGSGTANLGTTIAANSKRASNPAAVGVLSFAANQATGLAENGGRIALPANDNRPFLVGYVLAQDNSIDFDFTGTLTTDVDNLFLEWYEET